MINLVYFIIFLRNLFFAKKIGEEFSLKNASLWKIWRKFF